MDLVLTIPYCFVRWTVFVIGILAIVLGSHAFLWPKSALRFNVWVMSRVNWRVNPIDEVREVHISRRLGIYLIILGLGNLALFAIGMAI